MAIPRVFISSTCYDLLEIRDSLFSFITSFGFDVVLSEKGDIFYHPDLHTHGSCIKEIGNCQILVLIVGGRFGGNYIVDTTKSIVNAEYLAAKELDIPVFSFIKQEVLDDHRLYQKNKNEKNSIVSQIVFPSIENNLYANNIFEFINDIKCAKVNNGFFGFQYAKDIQRLLRKQWAGMFFEYLIDRKMRKQSEITFASLSQLETASNKIVQIVENIYKRVDANKANIVLDEINRKEEAAKFFNKISIRINSQLFLPADFISEMDLLLKNIEWYNFLGNIRGFHLTYGISDRQESRKTDVVAHDESSIIIGNFKGDRTGKEILEANEYQKHYIAFQKASPDMQKEIVSAYMYPF
jgi:hypothetical protein